MKKFRGFTLIELMIASTIATIVLIVSFSLIGNVYFARKQIRVAQNFYSEARFLLEKIVTISRENTIDYDRYFIEVGPNNSNCSSFSNSQGGPSHSGSSNKLNTGPSAKNNRETLDYPNIFYWKISDGVYRNLGGANISGVDDNCSQAFSGNLTELFLINKDRNMRTAIKNNNRIQTSIELGADTDDDGIADYWSPYYKWEQFNGVYYCDIYNDSNYNLSDKKLALIQDEKLCNQAHDFENISASRLKITSFNFTPYPDRDPFLNFRNDSAQIHPNVFLFMKIDLKNAADYGFTNTPTITMQTSVSSRVFGNTRK